MNESRMARECSRKDVKEMHMDVDGFVLLNFGFLHILPTTLPLSLFIHPFLVFPLYLQPKSGK